MSADRVFLPICQLKTRKFGQVTGKTKLHLSLHVQLTSYMSDYFLPVTLIFFINVNCLHFHSDKTALAKVPCTE